MRRKFVWSPERNELVEVPTNYSQTPRSHYVIPDLPDYTSPIDGRVVSGRRQRRNDLARSNSRPFEGLAAEKKEAARRVAYAEQKFDTGLERSAREAYHQMSPEKRRVLEGR
jgi:hypothetical protein